MDGPEDLTGKTTAHISIYTLKVRASGPLVIERPPELLPTPPRRAVLETPWVDPRGRQRKLAKFFRRRIKSTYSSPGLGVWRLSKPLP